MSKVSSEKKAKTVDLTWYGLLSEQCPLLKNLVEKEGKVDASRLTEIMSDMNLQPCGGKDDEECLQRNCATLWKYYVERKQAKVDTVLPRQSREVSRIAEHLFDMQGKFRYRPEDLAFLYDIVKVESATQEASSSTLNLVRRKGVAALKIFSKAKPHIVESLTRARFLQTEHPALLPYFVQIFQVEASTTTFQPSRRKVDTKNMYILQESMDGSFAQFLNHYRPRQAQDPDYFSRLQRMLAHALKGLGALHDTGFGLGQVDAEDLHFKIDFGYNVIGVKWGSFDQLAPIRHSTDDAYHSDLFLFGLLVYFSLFNNRPWLPADDEKWQAAWSDPKSIVHDNILRLRAPNALQPISTAAYHFLVNPFLFPDEKRWDFKQAWKYMNEHPPAKTNLSALPHVPTKW